jgi:ethanolamine utilization protein EutN
MILGRVIGEVWATRRDPRLGRTKLLVVRPHAVYEPAFASRHLVAADDVDAGVGDDVVVCLGAPARVATGGDDVPVDAAVLGVVDRVELARDGMASPGAGPGIRRALTVDVRASGELGGDVGGKGRP